MKKQLKVDKPLLNQNEKEECANVQVITLEALKKIKGGGSNDVFGTIITNGDG